MGNHSRKQPRRNRHKLVLQLRNHRMLELPHIRHNRASVGTGRIRDPVVANHIRRR
jgi:hypothetical protein